MVYVSITGLRVKSPLHFIPFIWHAIRSMTQINKAAGLIKAEARTINGIQHTLSVWKDEASMREYVISGAHLQAMKAFHSIASGKTYGYETDVPPHWDEVHDIWLTKGVETRKAK